MSFYGDYEGALWAIATGTSGAEDCQNAEIMRGIAQEALGQAWTDYLNHQKGAKDAFGKVIPFAESSPEQPSYKHPEKEIFNLSEDEGWDVSAEADEDLPTAEDVCGILAEDGTEANESDPITPAADLSPGGIINPVVDHEDNEFTGERTYIYADGTRSGPCPAPASWSPNGQAQE